MQEYIYQLQSLINQVKRDQKAALTANKTPEQIADRINDLTRVKNVIEEAVETLGEINKSSIW